MSSRSQALSIDMQQGLNNETDPAKYATDTRNFKASGNRSVHRWQQEPLLQNIKYDSDEDHRQVDTAPRKPSKNKWHSESTPDHRSHNANIESSDSRLGKDDNSKVLYVGRLNPSVTEHDLAELFAEYGQVESVFKRRSTAVMSSSHSSEVYYHYAFVRFKKTQCALLAMAELDGTYFGGSRIIVRPRNASGSDRASPSRDKTTVREKKSSTNYQSLSVGVSLNQLSDTQNARLLLVSNIPLDMYPEGLYHLFSEAGSVTSLIIHDMADENGKRCGDVLMASPESARKACEQFDGADVYGHILEVSFRHIPPQTTVVPLMYWAQQPGSSPRVIMYPRYALIPSYGHPCDYSMLWNSTMNEPSTFHASPADYYYPNSEYSYLPQYPIRSRAASQISQGSLNGGENGQQFDEMSARTSRDIMKPSSFPNEPSRTICGTFRTTTPSENDADRLGSLDHCNLFVKNLDDTVVTCVEELELLFSRYGDITSVYLSTFPKSGISRGFGFVAFRTPEQSARAKEMLDQVMVGRQRIFVSYARKDYPTVKSSKEPAYVKPLSRTRESILDPAVFDYRSLTHVVPNSPIADTVDAIDHQENSNGSIATPQSPARPRRCISSSRKSKSLTSSTETLPLQQSRDKNTPRSVKSADSAVSVHLSSTRPMLSVDTSDLNTPSASLPLRRGNSKHRRGKHWYNRKSFHVYSELSPKESSVPNSEAGSGSN